MNSYIRNLVPGEVSHEDCVVKVTNWNLAARMLGEAPTNETPQEQESQKAKFVKLNDTIEELQVLLHET
ncbi:hypothetical protein PtrSN002B_008337 [Pyrenophora tritici-repentis]|nr:hypothetical protein PtrV1_13275 [Pyrenophora tritici-repentis]KAG9383152.1 hypothetical protein A1F94_007073 [Pyrenophora tritici-repentis]KAI1530328.1 hypothetical protein PtrSN001A_008225 [Pyrenophora tritici-repentis]KAI1531938.1 hypothetical protein PtrSN001C_008129 [Pyrenophora tritici-repentis]KAI1541734.1 hypothetical protein PtrSN002B_008337 [Pyrenophora tritici-repentis]